MEHLDYYFEKNSNYGSTNGIVNRKIKLVNIFYPNLVRSIFPIINKSFSVYFKEEKNGVFESEARINFNNSTVDNIHNVNDFVDYVNNKALDSHYEAIYGRKSEIKLQVVNNKHVRWVNKSQFSTFIFDADDEQKAILFSPSSEIGKVIINPGITSNSFIPDLTSGLSNLEIRFSDNNILQVPWVGSYLSQTVYTFPTPLEIQLTNANRVEIRANYGAINKFSSLTTPVRRVLRLGFIEAE